MSEVYAVFEMNGWQRDFRPVEIFHDVLEARRFAAKLGKDNPLEGPEDLREWRVFRRTPTDWVKMSEINVND